MQTKLKRLISAVLALAMVLAWYVPGTVSAEDTTSGLPLKEDFDNSFSFAATSLARGIAATAEDGAMVNTVTDGESNTVLRVSRTTAVTAKSERYCVYARFGASGETWGDNATYVEDYQSKTVVYHFKYKPVKSTSLQVALRAQGTKGIISKLLEVNTYGTVKAFNVDITSSCKFETGTWYDIAFVCDFTQDTGKIWVNDIQIGESYNLLSWTDVEASNGLNAELLFRDRESSNTTEIEYYLDNIAIYEGTVPVDQFAQPDQPEQPEKVVCFKQNFAENNYKTTAGSGMSIAQGTIWPGTVTWNAENDGNHALKVTAPADTNTDKAYQIEARYSPTGEWGDGNTSTDLGDVRGKTAVYQFSVKINTNASFYMKLRTRLGTSTKTLTLVKIQDNVLKSGNSTIANLTPGQWYTVAVVLAFPNDGTNNIQSNVYLNGERKGSYGLSLDNSYLAVTNYMVVFNNIKSSNTDDFLLDNIAVYEASEIDENLFGGSFDGKSVALTAELGVNFFTTGEGTVKVSNTNSGSSFVEAVRVAEDDSTWKHTVSVLPQNMMNVMTAGLYGTDGELIDADIFELSEYIDKVKANHEKYYDVAEKTLQYCKAAAIYMEKYTEEGFTVPAVTTDLTAYEDTLVEGVTTRLVLDDACDLKIYIPASYAEETLMIDGMVIGIVQKVCKVDGDGDYECLVATGLLPQNYDTQYAVTIGEDECKISPLGWMQRYIPMNTNDTPRNQLVWALYAYHVAAQNFSGQN